MHERRKQKIKRNVVSFLIGCIIGVPFCVGHIRSVLEWKETNRKWVVEQTQRDFEDEEIPMESKITIDTYYRKTIGGKQ